jgi:energy-coupling factor transport system permease protein
MINYSPGSTPLHRLNGATKVSGFIAITVYIIMTFDVRVMLPMFVLCCAGAFSLRPNWKPVLFMPGSLFVTAGVFGTLMIILIRPSSGYGHVGAESVFYRFGGGLYLSKELLWYAGAMFFKRLCSFASAILFILSITPSELAAGLNKLRLPYSVCTIVSLAFRTIPDIARDYGDIKNSLMMRGVELDSRKAGPAKRLRQTAMILAPLIMTSFGKVGNIANAMDLRGFGKHRRRSWYSEREPDRADWIARAAIALIAAFSVYYIVFHRIINPPPFDYWCPWVAFG